MPLLALKSITIHHSKRWLSIKKAENRKGKQQALLHATFKSRQASPGSRPKSKRMIPSWVPCPPPF